MEVKKTGKWMDRPEGLLAAVRAIKRHLSDSDAYALTARQLNRAARLLGVHGARGLWHMGPEWKKRLRWAGIDPETCEIVDEVRFSHALDYMRATETFREADFKRWLEEHEEPSAVPAVAVPQRPHPSSVRGRELREREMRVSGLLSERMREKCF